MVREWIDDVRETSNRSGIKSRDEQIHNSTTHNDSQNALRKRRCVCRVDIIIIINEIETYKNTRS